MKDLTPIRGRRYINSLVSLGEHENQDFKFAVCDPRKIARSISAFANNSGGHLLIGVKDNGRVAGVRDADEEIYVVEKAAERYCYPPQKVDFSLFSYDTDVFVVRASVSPSDTPPVEVDEGDGVRRAYYRVADENIIASRLMTDAWRRRTEEPGISLSFEHSSLAGAVLHALSAGPLSPEKIALSTHASLASVTDTIASLAAIRMVTFHFDGKHFLPRLPED